MTLKPNGSVIDVWSLRVETPADAQARRERKQIAPPRNQYPASGGRPEASNNVILLPARKRTGPLLGSGSGTLSAGLGGTLALVAFLLFLDRKLGLVGR